MHFQHTTTPPSYKEIPLSGKYGAGKVAIVDAADYEWLMQWRWYCARDPRKSDYARGTVNGKHMLMHRFITGAPAGVMIDHINGDGLDNRRENLRHADHSRNKQNAKRRSQRFTSRYKGVHKEPIYGHKWIAQLCVNGKVVVVGRCDSEEEAARAYNEAALRHFGEFAHINEIPD